jgi:hypothetical protein
MISSALLFFVSVVLVIFLSFQFLTQTQTF